MDMTSIAGRPPLSPTPLETTERRLVVIVSASIVLSTLVPYVLHWAQTVPGMQYTGLERFINDQCSYLMWINQVRRGHWLVSNLYVHDLTDRFAPNPLWALIGALGRVVPVGTVGLYHAARVGLGFAYLLALFALAGRMFPDRTTRWVGWLLAALGGGLGWVYWAISGVTDLRGMWVSADYMPEMWTYPSLLYFPHFAASLLLMVGCLCRLCDAWRDGTAWAPVHAGLLLGLLAWVHTYTAVTVVAILLVQGLLWLVLQRRFAPVFWPNVVTLCVSSPWFAAQGWQTLAHESLWRWAESNVMPSPSPVSYLFGFGLPGFVGLWGLFQGLAARGPAPQPRQADPAWCLLVAWIVGTAVLLYAPVPFQRRCVEGLHIAFAFLAAPWAMVGARALSGGKPGRVRGLTAAFVCVTALTSAWYLLRELPSREGYVDRGVFGAEQEAYQRLGPGAAILCDGALGQWVPVRGRLRVYLGHCQLSFDHDRRQRLVMQMFSSRTSPLKRLALFHSTRCAAVLAYGGQIRLLRADRAGREEQPLWLEVFSSGRIALFVPRQDVDATVSAASTST